METNLETLRLEAERLQASFGAHGFEHTLRVFEECRRLGEELHADMSILLPAAILHDIARSEENHASRSAEKVAPILRNHGYPDDKIKAIQEAIRTHSFSANQDATSLEAKILSDADKLDAIGATGVYRAAAYSGEVKRPIRDFKEHFHEKLLKLKDLLYTEEAKRIAENRTDFMRLYLEQLNGELRGDR